MQVMFFSFFVVVFCLADAGSRRARRGLKWFPEAVGFILAEFEPKPSHGDPIRGQNCGFGTSDMCWNIEYMHGVYIYIYIWISF